MIQLDMFGDYLKNKLTLTDLGGVCHNCHKHKYWVEISRTEWDDGKQIDVELQCMFPTYDEEGAGCGPCDATVTVSV